MFTDKETGIIIHADLDATVIRATLRPQDLIPAFLDVIKETPQYQDLSTIVPLHAQEDDDAEWWDSEESAELVSYLVNEDLWDVLNMYAPEGYYFGCTEGDGSDFGYWKFEEEDV